MNETEVEDTAAYRRFAHGLPLAPSNAIHELCDEVDRLRTGLDRVRAAADRLEADGFVGIAAVIQGAIETPTVPAPQPQETL